MLIMEAIMGKTYNIAVIPGDGTGPEVVAEGIKVIDAISNKLGFKLDYTYYDLGGERYLKTGEILPDSVLNELRQFNAIYLGAIGHPGVQPGVEPSAAGSEPGGCRGRHRGLQGAPSRRLRQRIQCRQHRSCAARW